MDTEFNFDFDRQEKRKKIIRIVIKIIKWAVAVAIAIVLGWLFTVFAFEKTNMVGSGMEPTLSDDDILLVNKVAYHFSDPERFDVIVFNKTGKEHSYYATRRIIGLPGETVSISEGKVYINGEPLKEMYAVDEMLTAGLAENPITLDEDEYFVLGDNRNDCEDSRYSNFSNVVRNEIVGIAFVRLNNFGIIDKLNLVEEESEEQAQDNN